MVKHDLSQSRVEVQSLVDPEELTVPRCTVPLYCTVPHKPLTDVVDYLVLSQVVLLVSTESGSREVSRDPLFLIYKEPRSSPYHYFQHSE